MWILSKVVIFQADNHITTNDTTGNIVAAESVSLDRNTKVEK